MSAEEMNDRERIISKLKKKTRKNKYNKKYDNLIIKKLPNS